MRHSHGNVAILMKKLGHDVLGSDKGMYDPMKSALAAAGVRSYEAGAPAIWRNFPRT